MLDAVLQAPGSGSVSAPHALKVDLDGNDHLAIGQVANLNADELLTADRQDSSQIMTDGLGLIAEVDFEVQGKELQTLEATSSIAAVNMWKSLMLIHY